MLRGDLLLGVASLACTLAALGAIAAMSLPQPGLPFVDYALIGAFCGGPPLALVLGGSAVILAAGKWRAERADGGRPTRATVIALGLGLSGAMGSLGWLALMFLFTVG